MHSTKSEGIAHRDSHEQPDVQEEGEMNGDSKFVPHGTLADD